MSLSIPSPHHHIISGPGAQLHGNPGDYAWGRGGLDAIITQLLNQMDGAGPPPMATDLIQQIPTVKVTKEMMEKNSSCSVCWEVGEINILIVIQICYGKQKQKTIFYALSPLLIKEQA